MLEKLRTNDAKLKKAKELFGAAISADTKWQIDARDDFKFRDGNQWTTEEKHILEEELRPVLTFNLTKSSVDLIMGMNEDNKKVFRASPIDPTDGFLCEVLNDITEWVSETNEFGDEEDAALESATICGRGFCAIDFAPDPKRFGEIDMTEVEVSVHEVHFDPAARRPNLEDASYLCWDRWMAVQEFQMRYPKIKGKKLEDIRALSRDLDLVNALAGTPVQHAFEIPVDFTGDDSDYDQPLDFNYYDKARNMVRVIHMEYWENYTRYFVFNPEVGLFEEAPEKPTKEIKELFLEEFGEEMTVETLSDKRVRWLQFTGDHILYDDLSPLPFGGFSIVPLFAFSDVSKRTMNHFGIIRLIKDPQKEVNKRWSQALNLLNQQVQPGIFAETDAFVDAAQAEQSMKEAGAISWTNAGALTGGKIQERNMPTFPNAPMQMEQFSQDIMKKITGINPDLLGQDRGRQEPGVVIRLRQQQGVTLLKPLFKSYDRMRKGLFKRQLSIIMEYMPDEQILRILGQNDRYQIDRDTGIIVDSMSIDPETGQPTLVADIRDVRNLEYNVRAEESPGNMTKRTLEMTMLMEMQQSGFPVDPIQILEKMDLAESEKQRWIKYIQDSQAAEQQQQQEMFETELAMKERELANEEKKDLMDFMVDIAKINQMSEKDDKKMIEDFAKMDVEQQNNIAQFTVNMLKVISDAQKEEQGVQGADDATSKTKRSKS